MIPNEDFRRNLAAHLQNQKANPMKLVRSFIGKWSVMDTEAEIEIEFREKVKNDQHASIMRTLAAIENVLENETNGPEILELVRWNSKTDLDVEDIVHAFEWLREKANWIVGIVSDEMSKRK